MKKAVSFTAFLLVLILASCGPAEWKKENSLGKEAEDSGDLELAIEHYKKSVELKPRNEEAQKDLRVAKEKLEKELLEEKERLEKKKRLKEQQEKFAAEEERKKKEKEAAEIMKREETKKKNRAKVDEVVAELIDMGDGSIKNIRPTSNDDWIAVYVEVENTWHLFSHEEQRYIAETIGPAVESAIIGTGITDYCDVHFIDENGTTVASPKFMGGGYKIK